MSWNFRRNYFLPGAAQPGFLARPGKAADSVSDSKRGLFLLPTASGQTRDACQLTTCRLVSFTAPLTGGPVQASRRPNQCARLPPSALALICLNFPLIWSSSLRLCLHLPRRPQSDVPLAVGWSPREPCRSACRPGPGHWRGRADTRAVWLCFALSVSVFLHRLEIVLQILGCLCCVSASSRVYQRSLACSLHMWTDLQFRFSQTATRISMPCPIRTPHYGISAP